jgi:integrase
LKHLPPHLTGTARFAYLTGWRKKEILNLEWAFVNLQAGVIRLDPELPKNDKGRVLVLVGELKRLIETQYHLRGSSGVICPYVFHRNSKPIKDHNKAWRRARQQANLEGEILP